MAATRRKGVSLAKGPIGIIGMILLAYGVTALIFGGRSFTTHALDGTVTGKTWLGLEVNGWSSVLCIVAGALLVFGSPLHWGAKGMSILVALVLGAAAVLLLLLALLPRVGGGDKDEEQDFSARRVVERESPR